MFRPCLPRPLGGVFRISATAISRRSCGRSAPWRCSAASGSSSRDPSWRAVAFAVTAAALALLARPLREPRLWLAGWGFATATARDPVVLAGVWIVDDAEPTRFAIAALAAAAALVVLSALAWGDEAGAISSRSPGRPRSWPLILGEAFLVGGGPATAFVAALTGALSRSWPAPLHEQRLWWAGARRLGHERRGPRVVTPPWHFVMRP